MKDQTKALDTRGDSKAVASVETTRAVPTFVPNVDIYETDEELLLLADMPGVDSEHLDVIFEKGQLVIHGKVQERGDERKRLLFEEYEPGDFRRVFEVDEAIDSSKICAEHRDGVLRLHLPKVEAVKPRRIEIKS